MEETASASSSSLHGASQQPEAQTRLSRIGRIRGQSTQGVRGDMETACSDDVSEMDDEEGDAEDDLDDDSSEADADAAPKRYFYFKVKNNQLNLRAIELGCRSIFLGSAGWS